MPADESEPITLIDETGVGQALRIFRLVGEACAHATLAIAQVTALATRGVEPAPLAERPLLLVIWIAAGPLEFPNGRRFLFPGLRR